MNHLTQSILAKALDSHIVCSGYAQPAAAQICSRQICRGELTADWRAQNPDLISGNNSAEALLARIRAARANDPGRKKRGRGTTA